MLTFLFYKFLCYPLRAWKVKRVQTMTKGRKNVRSATASLHDTKVFFTLHIASNLVSALLSTLAVSFDVVS